MNVSGFNHVTFGVSNLENSLAFYMDILGMRLTHRGRKDAYLEWGTAWVHIAFSIDEADFDGAVTQLRAAKVPIVRGPVQRGQGWAINFLDPDGTQLELHTSDLQQRMAVWS